MAKKDDEKGISTAPLVPIVQMYEVTFTAISDESGGLRRQGEIVPESDLRDVPRLLEIGAIRVVAASAVEPATAPAE